MKVLIVSGFASKSNSSRPLAQMLLGLKRNGVDVDVVMADYSYYYNLFLNAGMQVFVHHIPKKIDFSSIRYIRKLVKSNKYDIVHLYNNKAANNGILATIGLPVKVITYRGYTGNVLWYKPTSYINHLNPKVDKITCVSNAVRDQVRRQFLFNKNKAITVYKGHDTNWYKDIKPVSREGIGVPDEAFMIVLVANARIMKGVKYFIEASHYLKDDSNIHFVMIGKGMDSPEYKAMINKSPLKEHFHVFGFRSDSLNIVSSSDVAVLTSIKGEGLSRTTIEAMSLSKPVIATDIGGNSELVIHNKTGVLIPPKSPQAIAEAIRKMKNNPGWRKNLAENAYNHIDTNFRVENSVQQMKKVYENLMSQ